MLTSVTAGSLGGRFGGEARRLALALAREGLLHNVASDAHDAVNRTPEHRRGARAGRARPACAVADRAVPAAILGGEEIPPAPVGSAAVLEPARRGWWRSLRR